MFSSTRKFDERLLGSLNSKHAHIMQDGQITKWLTLLSQCYQTNILRE